MLFPWRLTAAVTTASTVVSTVAAVRERRNRQRVEAAAQLLKRNMTSELRLAAAVQLRIETELEATRAKRAVAQAYGESMEDAYEREQDRRRKELSAMEAEARNTHKKLLDELGILPEETRQARPPTDFEIRGAEVDG